MSGLKRLSLTPAFQPRRAALNFWSKTAVGCKRLLDGEPSYTIDGMNVVFELPPAQAERLRREAERLGISPSELARAALSDLLADRDEDFRSASERVLRKNAALYRRLA